MQTFLDSVKKRSDSHPPSRPNPELFIPPNGVRKSRNNQQFTQIIPAFIFEATVCARFKFSVQILADNPYSVEFENRMASSSFSNGINETTGPKISS